MSRRLKLMAFAAVGLALFWGWSLTGTLSNEDFFQKLRNTKLPVRLVGGEELKQRREYIASHGSFVFLTLAKLLASPGLKTSFSKGLLSGQAAGEISATAVREMPGEEKGIVLLVDGLTVEVTRFPHPGFAQAVARMQSGLQKMDFSSGQCDDPRYKKRMTCSRLEYIPRKNFLIAVSNIKKLVEIRDVDGSLLARDYEPMPEEKFTLVVTILRKL